MSSLEVILCAAGACLGQVEKKPPSPDRFVKITVRQAQLPPWVEQDFRNVKETMLLIDRINFGFQFQKPNDTTAHGHPDKDFSRFAGSYFHPRGPAGIALRKIDWFPGKPNTYHADARLPATLVGQALNGSLGMIATLWSEPPYAVLGIDAGSLVSFAKPCQTVHCVDRIPKVVELSAPTKGNDPTFTFIQDAKNRGAWVEVENGELRATLEKKKIKGFYHLMFIQPHVDGEITIQKDLFTKEGMTALMDAMVEEGVICFHTSSRYFEFPRLLADVCQELGFACRRGHDSLRHDHKELSHFTSEWVMVARKGKYLEHLVAPEGYKSETREPYWSTPAAEGKYVWSDAGKKSMKGMVRSDPKLGSLASSLYEVQDALAKSGISQEILRPIFESVQNMMRAYGERVARERDY